MCCVRLRSAIWSFFLLVIFSGATGSAAFGQVSTEHNDVLRSGAYTTETKLTYANVNSGQFGKLFTDAVDGFVVGQPLYIPGMHLPDGTTHNVVYVATQHDSVYAFDADSAGPPLWQVSFINPAAGITSVPISNYGCTGTGFTEVGIMSTPVVDQTAGAIYLVAKTLENGSYIFRLHALSLTTGEDILPPVVISASISTQKGTVQFNPATQMQRAGLLLLNGTLYLGFGSNGCDTFVFHGWLLAYSQSTLQKMATFLTTPNGSNGGIWQGGGGPAADSDGTLFLATGNGTFDANTGGSDWGDSVLHLDPATSGMGVIDSFTPFDQASLNTNDVDLGSGGVLLLPDQSGAHPHELVIGGKIGTLYLLDRDSLGHYNSSGDTQVVQSIPNAVAGEMHGVPAYWNGNIFVAGDNDHIRAFSLSNGLLSSQPTSMTSVLFNQSGPESISVSSDSSLNNGIIWGLIHGGSVSYLYAFKASNLASQLYSSTQAPSGRDAIKGVPHFQTPTIANGKLFIGGTNMLYVFGLLPSLSPSGGNKQTGYLGTTLPVPLTISAKDVYSGNPLANISLTCKDGGLGGTFSNPTPVTNSQGQASTTYTLPVKRMTITITCTSPGFAPASFSETAASGPATRIVASSGNYQVAPVSTKLPKPLVATVYDSHGYGVQGVSVTFSDGGAGGSFSCTTCATAYNGQASTVYTTPANSGLINVTASVAGLTSITFKVTAYGTPVRLAITGGNNQTASPSTQLPVTLGVAVFDSNNVGVPGVTLTFSDGGAGGSLSPSSAVTASNGRTSAIYTTPPTAGTFYVTASANGLSPIKFKVTVN